MKFLGLALVAALALSPLAAADKANAVPASGTIVGNISEGGPSPRHPLTVPLGAALVDDFSQDPGDGKPEFTLAGSSHILGTIKDANSGASFKDAWTMTLKRASRIYFSWMPHEVGDPFDGVFGSPLDAAFAFTGTGSEYLGILGAGTWQFTVDAAAGGTTEQLGHWKVSAVVPLPAGGILLLTALGGLALFRSRKRA